MIGAAVARFLMPATGNLVIAPDYAALGPLTFLIGDANVPRTM